MQSAVLATVYPFICPSQLVLSQNNSRYHHAVFTGGQGHDSNFITVNFSVKFQREHRERGRRI